MSAPQGTTSHTNGRLEGLRAAQRRAGSRTTTTAAPTSEKCMELTPNDSGERRRAAATEAANGRSRDTSAEAESSAHARPRDGASAGCIVYVLTYRPRLQIVCVNSERSQVRGVACPAKLDLGYGARAPCGGAAAEPCPASKRRQAAPRAAPATTATRHVRGYNKCIVSREEKRFAAMSLQSHRKRSSDDDSHTQYRRHTQATRSSHNSAGSRELEGDEA